MSKPKFSHDGVETQTVAFVCASDLFNGLKSLWNQFIESSPPFSWGNNNRTLVTAESILDHCDDCDICDHRQLPKLRKRIETLPRNGQMYIDLEN